MILKHKHTLKSIWFESAFILALGNVKWWKLFSTRKDPKKERKGKLQERRTEKKSFWHLQKARLKATRRGETLPDPAEDRGALETLLDPAEDRGGRGASLRLRYRDRRTFGVVKPVHGAHLHDHVQAIDEGEQQDEQAHQGHPNPRGEEAGTVAGVREVCPVGQPEALDLHHQRESTKHKASMSKAWQDSKTFMLTSYPSFSA